MEDRNKPNTDLLDELGFKNYEIKNNVLYIKSELCINGRDLESESFSNCVFESNIYITDFRHDYDILKNTKIEGSVYLKNPKHIPHHFLKDTNVNMLYIDSITLPSLFNKTIYCSVTIMNTTTISESLDNLNINGDLNLPELESVGVSFLSNSLINGDLYMPKIKSCGISFLENATINGYVEIPNYLGDKQLFMDNATIKELCITSKKYKLNNINIVKYLRFKNINDNIILFYLKKLFNKPSIAQILKCDVYFNNKNYYYNGNKEMPKGFVFLGNIYKIKNTYTKGSYTIYEDVFDYYIAYKKINLREYYCRTKNIDTSIRGVEDKIKYNI